MRRIPAGATVLQVTDDRLWSEFSTAVYIAAEHVNIVRYVGSVCRHGSVADRIQEHVLNGRADHWTRLMVIPPQTDTEVNLVRKIEGRVGAVPRPLDVLRLPRLSRSQERMMRTR